MLYFHLFTLLFVCLWRTQVSGQRVPPYQNAHPVQKLLKEHLKISSSSPLLATNHQQQQHDIEATPIPTSNLAAGTKQFVPRSNSRTKRAPTGFSARGIHEDIFDRDFGHFSPVKRRPEADASGFYGDTFSGGFGEFETMKRALPLFEAEKRFGMLLKRRPEMGAQGFHGDTFAQGFGDFDTMKRSQQYMNWLEKRRPEMTKSGFHGDVFNGGFGEFHPMRK